MRRTRSLVTLTAFAVAAPALVVAACGGGANRAPGAVQRTALVRLDGAAPPAAAWNTEEYDRIDENPFIDPRIEPLSTLGADVDTASYANTRRFLYEGTQPPAGAVRIEELVNYFDYGYLAPDGDVPFSVTTEVAECPWSPSHSLLHIGLKGRQREPGTVL